MTISNMGPRDLDFLISEANGNYSREEATATGGADGITSGMLVFDNGGTWEQVAAAGTPEGIAGASVAATETGKILVIVRQAEIQKAELVYPTGATQPEIDALDTALAGLGMVLR